MFPLVPRFARERVDRAGGEEASGAVEAARGTGRFAAAQAEGGGGFERDADHMFEHRPVAVPADAGAGVVAGDQGVDEVGLGQAGEPGGAGAQGKEEGGDRLRGAEARIVEVVAPAE